MACQHIGSRDAVNMIILSGAVLLVFISSCVHGADPVFSPSTITDNGHVANENSSITWGSPPAGKQYAGDESYNDGGLGPLFNGARNFINMVQPNAFPTDMVKSLIAGTFDFGSDYLQIVLYVIGFAVCFGIGILYILITPLVGFIFCCCRCFGKCGGKMTQNVNSSSGCKRTIFSLTCFILTLFMGVGMICTYVTSEHIMTAVRAVGSTTTDQMDNAELYLNNTLQEINFLGPQSFNFTSQVIARDLDNIGYLVGIPVRQDLLTNGGVNSAINSILNMESTISTVSASLFAVNASINEIKENAVHLSGNLSDIQQQINITISDPACLGCSDQVDVTTLQTDVNFDALPDISSEVNQMQDVTAKNLTALVIQGKQEFEDIPQRVQNETASTVSDIKGMLSDFNTQIDSTLQSVNNMPQSIVPEIAKYKTMVSDYSQMAEEYDQYRWYGSIGLASTILIIVVLQVFGLVLGCLCSSADTNPKDRNCCSNCGGLMLMAATGFIFIFSVLLMLLTSTTFLVGGNLEKLVCEPLKDPQLKDLSELLDGPNGYFKEYMLGKLILQNGTVPLTIAGVLSDCKNNKGAMAAFKLDNLFDIQQIADVQSKINITSEMDKINVDLSSVGILSTDTENQLRDFSSSTSIDFNQFNTELSKGTTQANLTAFAELLELLAANSTSPVNESLINHASDLRDLDNGLAQTVRDKQAQLLTNVQSLNSSMANIPATVNSTLDNAKSVESYLQQNGSQLIKDQATVYGTRLLGIAESYINHTLDKIVNTAGGCQPLYNLYTAITSTVLCKYFVDTLNGFWFSLGWAIFFMVPSLIINVKLAKYYRRMKDSVGIMKPPSRSQVSAA